MPYLGKSPSQGVRTRFQFTPNAGTTSISGADANGLTLSFTDGNYVDVYLNGVMLKAGVDYNTNTANTIAGLSATVASDVVDIVVYDTFSLFGGTLEGNVKVNNGTFNVTGAVDFDSTLNVDGVVTTDGATHDGDVTFTGANYNVVWDKSDNALEFGDNAKAIFGAGSDLIIQHDGSRSIIQDNGTGNLRIQANNLELKNADNSHDYVFCSNGGAVELYHNNSKKLETTSTGVTVTGSLTANGGVVVDNITIDGTEIDLSSGDLTIDVAGNINLNADGGQVVLLDGSTQYGNFLMNNSGDITLHIETQDKDFKITGNDGGSSITALTLDMSDAGTATFNHDIRLGDNGQVIFGDGSDLTLYSSGADVTIAATQGTLTIDVAGDITLDAGGGDILLKDDGTLVGTIGGFASNNVVIKNEVSNGDIVFDGNGVSDALKLDMSNSGFAFFNANAFFNENSNDTDFRIKSTGTTNMFYVDASTNRIGIGTDTPGSVFHIVGNTKIENNASYFADTLAAVNSTAMALNISPTRASVTKCIAMGAIGSINTHTGLQAYDSSDNSANNFSINPLGGRVSIGTSAPVSPAGHNSGLAVEGTDYHSATISISANSANSNGAYLMFSKSRGSSLGSTTVVADSDTLGYIGFNAADGLDVAHISASIYSQVDGSPGNNDTPGKIIFATTPDDSASLSNRMYITSAGVKIMNNTTHGNITSGNSSGASFDSAGTIHSSRATTSNSLHWYLYNSNGHVGSISTNGSATQFNTSSDYRLKENVVTDWDATSRLKQLKPSRFNFKADKDTTVDGFLAHEVSSIVPEAISGEKDATKKITGVVLSSTGAVLSDNVKESEWVKGKTTYRDEIQNIDVAQLYPSDSTWVAEKDVPDYQSIDQSKLVPLLVKTIQELEARIATLEGE